MSNTITFVGGPYDGYEINRKAVCLGDSGKFPVCAAAIWCILECLPERLPDEAYEVRGVAIYCRFKEGKYRHALTRPVATDEMDWAENWVSRVINCEVERQAREVRRSRGV